MNMKKLPIYSFLAIFLIFKVANAAVALTIPTLTSPINDFELGAGTVSANLQWNKNNTGASYAVRLVNVTDNIVLLNYQNVGDVGAYTASGLQDGKSYRWVVRAVKSGSADAETGPATFKVANAAVALTIPTLTSPINDFELGAGTVSANLQWNKNNTGASYAVRLVNLTDNIVLLNYQNVGDVGSYTASGLQDGKSYRWVVRAVKSGSADAETGPATFKVANAAVALTIPTLTSPINDFELGAGTVSANLQWNKNNTGASYAVRLVNVTDNIVLLNYQNVGDVGAYTASGLQNGKSYRWVVRAVKSGSADAETGPATFKVANAAVATTLKAPILINPTNNYTFLDVLTSGINYQWLQGGNTSGTKYFLRVRNETTGLLIVDNLSVGTGTAQSVTLAQHGNKLVSGSSYIWNIWAIPSDKPDLKAGETPSSFAYAVKSSEDFIFKIEKSAVVLASGDDYPDTYKKGNCPNYNEPPRLNEDIDVWGFYLRQCTSFVAWRMNRNAGATSLKSNDPFRNNLSNPALSNAKNWATRLGMLGYVINNIPVVGCIAQWDANTNGALDNGHVAYVSKVSNDGTIEIEEYNWVPSCVYNKRTIKASVPTNFIHFNSMLVSSTANLVADGSIVSNNSTIELGKSINVSAAVKNIGQQTWNGCLFLSIHKNDANRTFVADITQSATISLTGNNSYGLKFDNFKLDASKFTSGAYILIFKQSEDCSKNNWVTIGEPLPITINTVNQGITELLQLSKIMSFGINSNLQAAGSYTFTTSVKNTSGIKWVGNFRLVLGGASNILDWVGITIEPNNEYVFSKQLSIPNGIYGNSVKAELFYQSTDDTTPMYLVPKGNFTNPLIINIDPPLKADFTYQVGTAGKATTFTDISTGNATRWAWNFGDGKISAEQNPVNTYAKIGIYKVKLTITKINGVNVFTEKDIQIVSDNGSVVEVPAINYGVLTVPTNKVIAGTTLKINGLRFSSNKKVNILVSSNLTNQTATATTTGTFAATLTIPLNTKAGNYTITAFDEIKGQTQALEFTVIETTSNKNDLKIIGVTTTDKKTWTIKWEDILYTVSGCNGTSTGQIRYNYDVELITYLNSSTSVSKSLFSQSGEDNANSRIIQIKDVVLNSNPSALNYKVKITERCSNRSAESNSFDIPKTVISMAISTAWALRAGEKEPFTKINGIAADGTARMFISVKPNTAEVKKIQIKLTDDNNTTGTRLLGKLKKASTTINNYNEANDASLATEFTTSPSVDGSYVFWYVAPNDFARSAIDNNSSERQVNLEIELFDANGQSIGKETSKITIVRPILVYAHGLGGDTGTFDSFLLRKSTVFPNQYSFDFYANDAFDKNASMLLGTQKNEAGNYNDSFDNVIQSFRESKGIVSNRVDYVAHSMGGCIARTAEHKAGFYSDKNYQKGYINKFITLDTPHQNSPLGDIVTDLATSISGLFTTGPASMTRLNNYFTYKFSDFGGFASIIGPSDAVRDLAVGSGINLTESELKTHFIVGNFTRNYIGENYSTYNNYLTDAAKSIGALDKKDRGSLNALADALTDAGETKYNGLYQKEKDVNKKKEYQNMMNFFVEIKKLVQDNTRQSLGTVALMNKYSELVYPAGQRFFDNSDIIVSTESQMAGNNSTSTFVSVFNNVNHAFEPSAVVNDQAVGNRVWQLLNAPIESNLFTSVIPKTTNRVTSERTTNNFSSGRVGQPAVTSDTTKIKILNPSRAETTLTIGQAVTLQLQVKDTTQLEYVELRFQNQNFLYNDKKKLYTIVTQPNAPYIGKQKVSAKAVYRNKDGSLDIYWDYVDINVVSNESVISLMAQPTTLNIKKSQQIQPQITVQFNTFETILPLNDPNIVVNISNLNLLRWDAQLGIFTGMQDGETNVNISYRNQSITLKFIISGGVAFVTSVESIEPAVQKSSEVVNSIICYPNPTLNGFTNIEFQISKSANVQLEIIDLTGKVEYVFTKERLQIGKHKFEISFDNHSSGVYFYRLISDNEVHTGKIVLIK